MKNIKLILQYDGTNYHGFQIQPDVATIQQSLNEAVFLATGDKATVNGCSRTDAGVHAISYCAGFATESPIPADRFSTVLNNYLPDDIKVLESALECDDFHPRFSVSSKEYMYIIDTNPNPDVFSRNYSWQYKKPLNIVYMQEACQYIIGKKDFVSFMTSGPEMETTVRNIMDLHVETDGDKIKIFIRADGFLYNMVRIITGTLVLVGEGKILPKGLKNIIDGKNRNLAGPTAPPQGLYLNKIFYE